MKFKEKVMCNKVLVDLSKVILAEDDFLKGLKFNKVKIKACDLMLKQKIPADFYYDIFAKGIEDYWKAESFAYEILKWHCEVNPADKTAKKVLAIMKAEQGIE